MTFRPADCACERTDAHLRVLGDDLVVADVSRAMGLAPDLAREKGYLIFIGERIVAQPTGVWAVRSRASGNVLERHVESLLDLVEDRCRRLRAPGCGHALTFDVFCLWIGDSTRG